MEEAARHSTVAHQGMWDQAIADAVQEASTQMGVTFVYDVDKEAFRKATSGMLVRYSEQYPGVKQLLQLISDIRAQSSATGSGAEDDAATAASATAGAATTVVQEVQ